MYLTKILGNLKISINKNIKETKMSISTTTIYPVGTYIDPEPDDYFTMNNGSKAPQVPDPDGYSWAPSVDRWVKTNLLNKVSEITSGAFNTCPVLEFASQGDGTYRMVRSWATIEQANQWIAFCNENNYTVTLTNE